MTTFVKVDTEEGSLIIDTAALKAVVPYKYGSHIIMRDHDIHAPGNHEEIVKQIMGGVTK